MSKRLKKVSEETLAQNPYWDYKHDVYELPDGTHGDYYYGEENGSAMIVPILDDGRLVLVVQQRYLRDKPSVEFPCGGLNKDETPQEGAARELQEETGFQSTNFIKSGAFDALNGLFKDTTHVFVADELVKQSEPSPDATENFEILYRRVEEFEEMIRRGEIWDGQTLAVWALSREQALKKIYERQG
jgi:ADP-ribose pyrophosphatase